MFGISMWELGLILLVALIVLGPRQLADAARVAGRMYGELMRLAREARSSMDLDSLTSTAPQHHIPDAYGQDSDSKNQDIGQAITPGQRSGPDFYAELLEKSKEDDKDEQSGPPSAAAGDQAPAEGYVHPEADKGEKR